MVLMIIQIAATIADADSVNNDFLEETATCSLQPVGYCLTKILNAPDDDAIDNPEDTPIAGVTVELFNADGNGNRYWFGDRHSNHQLKRDSTSSLI